MTNYYIGLQNKQGIVDIPPYVGNSSDGAAVDIELNINGSAIPDRTTAIMLVQKLMAYLGNCTWPPTNQAL
jgi:hypothetical protein